MKLDLTGARIASMDWRHDKFVRASAWSSDRLPVGPGRIRAELWLADGTHVTLESTNETLAQELFQLYRETVA